MTDTSVIRQMRAVYQARREHSEALFVYAEGALGAVTSALNYVHTLRARIQGADGNTAPVLETLAAIEESLADASHLVVTSYTQALETYPKEVEA